MKTTMFVSGSKFYAFRDTQYVRAICADNPVIEAGYPMSIAEGWNLPEPFASRIDAALQIEHKCYLFSGGRILRRDRVDDVGPGTDDPHYVHTIAELPWHGFGADGIDAIFVRPDGRSGLAFKGDKYIVFQVGTDEIGPVLADYPRGVTSMPWNGFGDSGIDSAVAMGNVIYLFANSTYITVTDEGDCGLDENGQPVLEFPLLAGPLPESDFLRETPTKKRALSLLNDRANWLSQLDDTLSIYHLSLPGTHDSGAINSATRTPAACQYESLTSQLENGVRLLDIRVRVDMVPRSPSAVDLTVCHGDFFVPMLYAKFNSALAECKAFLDKHPREFIAMSVKIDDWGIYPKGDANCKQAVAQTIQSMMGTYRYVLDQQTPTLLGCRGKIFVLDRINCPTVDLGLPIALPNNAKWAQVRMPSAHPLDVWVQDFYENLPSPEIDTKAMYVSAAIAQTPSKDLVLNYASATKGWQNLFGVYINWKFIYDTLYVLPKPTRLGWMFFDFALYGYPTLAFTSTNCVDVVICANESPPFSSFDGVTLQSGTRV